MTYHIIVIASLEMFNFLNEPDRFFDRVLELATKKMTFFMNVIFLSHFFISSLFSSLFLNQFEFPQQQKTTIRSNSLSHLVCLFSC